MLSTSIFFNQNSFAQNLVPNPSFEDTIACPTMGGQIYRAAGWQNWGITPDYLNSCHGGLLGTPQNGWGNQVPIDGNAYAGLVCNVSTISNAREFMGIQLIQPLIIGQTYYASFYVSLSDIPSGSCAINKIGIKCSTVSYDSVNLPALNNFAHVNTNIIVSDSLSWTKISGSFVADSAYTYLMLGNFYDNSQLDTFNCPTNVGTASYYFIDLVCVSPDAEYCNNDPLLVFHNGHKNDNVILYPIPADNILNIRSSATIKSLNIHSIEGRLLLSKNNVNQLNINISSGDFPNGTYFLQVFDSQSVRNYRFEIIHK